MCDGEPVGLHGVAGAVVEVTHVGVVEVDHLLLRHFGQTV